jgi:hypothetical protein
MVSMDVSSSRVTLWGYLIFKSAGRICCTTTKSAISFCNKITKSACTIWKSGLIIALLMCRTHPFNFQKSGVFDEKTGRRNDGDMERFQISQATYFARS